MDYTTAIDREYAQAKIDHATATRIFEQARRLYDDHATPGALAELKRADNERQAKAHRVMDYEARYRKLGRTPPA